ncbi:MAG: class I SAM-dependent methyltransferase [Xenococcaceae cyanobacterium MO_167.B52]|nr:class I SAM-dependent methyltransferase [Xenococcaceae cyanobacterium MO_167.B52]
MMPNSQEVNNAVAKLYNTYPFPPDPLTDDTPPGYNWRWNWIAAYNFCTGRKPSRQDIRILDAGCGTGSSTDYLIHLNPKAEVVAIDISEKALEVAQERCNRSGVIAKHKKPVTFKQLRLEEASQLSGEFDLINSVGVLHHLPDPITGIQELAKKLASGGIFHIFVYAELGRWEITLMQKAIALLQGNKRGDYKDGVKVGRDIFANLPEKNRLLKQEKERWALENHRDEAFADMYVHPQEIDYNIETLFQLIDASGLEFVGFSNPQYWNLERLIGNSNELISRAKNLSKKEYYRLIELLDPSLTHYEFFLARPPLDKVDWSDDQVLLKAIPERHPCMEGYPGKSFFNYDYQMVNISEVELAFLQACDNDIKSQQTVAELISNLDLDLTIVRSLQAKQLIILSTN